MKIKKSIMDITLSLLLLAKGYEECAELRIQHKNSQSQE